MDNGKIVSNLNPSLNPLPSSAMYPLNHGRFFPFAAWIPLRADSFPLVFEVEGEMCPAHPVLKGFQVKLDFIFPDCLPMKARQWISFFMAMRRNQYVSLV
jgi:hypothetical protein